MEISGNLYHDGTRVLVFGVCKSSTIDIVLVISGVLVVVLVPQNNYQEYNYHQIYLYLPSFPSEDTLLLDLVDPLYYIVVSIR